VLAVSHFAESFAANNILHPLRVSDQVVRSDI